mmetsp:Transcript_77098/g.216439  ORF Transcript_77098/g.216439 Transcript_77098/m.216439 type:complete len:89 (-) Transcript_77098:824-1090(-)
MATAAALKAPAAGGLRQAAVRTLDALARHLGVGTSPAPNVVGSAAAATLAVGARMAESEAEAYPTARVRTQMSRAIQVGRSGSGPTGC